MNKQWQVKRSFFPLIFAFFVAVGILTGCSSKDAKSTDTLSVTQIGEKIEQAVNLKELKEGDWDKLQKLYNIDADSVNEFILYTSTSNVKADELAIIKLKDPSQAKSVTAKIKQRIDAQIIKFKDYRPNEYFLLENHVLKTKGSFVFFAVSKEADQMEHAFDAAF